LQYSSTPLGIVSRQSQLTLTPPRGRGFPELNKDRDDFIERLFIILPETDTSSYAWALMPSHAIKL
ncbi:unnamed protein product, partial [marine sediment metagenome]